MATQVPLWRLFYYTYSAVRASVLDALFPIPPAEREVLAMNGIDAFKTLPRAPRCSIPEACSVFAYLDERVSRLIWSIKYKKSSVGAAIAGFALNRVVQLFSVAIPPEMRLVIVSMPITRQRRRERGFNQCELILNEMLKLDAAQPSNIILPSNANRRLLFAPDLLMRVRHTSRQTMKDREERLESAEDLFAVNEKSRMLPELRKNSSSYFIVVIDDVITTGSTIKDAIYTLRRAGFENTYGLSVAH